jgi:hypothetical protein
MTWFAVINGLLAFPWNALLLEIVFLFTKRIKFWSPDGRSNKSPTQGQALLYYGDNICQFRTSFERFGMIR